MTREEIDNAVDRIRRNVRYAGEFEDLGNGRLSQYYLGAAVGISDFLAANGYQTAACALDSAIIEWRKK